MKKPCIMIIIALCVIALGSTLPGGLSAAAAAKKKLYISTIRAGGVPAPLSLRVKEGVKLAIWEGYGDRYHVLDDDAVRVMFKQAEAIMASGCDDTSCITQIADGINADEIVYGELRREGGMLRVSLTGLERDRASLTLGTRSMVSFDFPESQVDHYARELGKKLMNKGYQIKKAAEGVEGAIALKAIDVQRIQGLDLSVIRFTTTDESAANILGFLKEKVGKGDALYGSKKYAGAREEYLDVLGRIDTRLTKESKKKIAGFTGGVEKRVGGTWSMELAPRVERIDAKLKEGLADEKKLKGILGEYEGVMGEIMNLPSAHRTHMTDLIASVGSRQDSVLAALLSHQMKRGDTAYNEYRFDEALREYEELRSLTQKIADAKLRAEQGKELARRIDAARSTGTSYLANRVKTHRDLAEFYNLKDESGAARKEMRKAYALITGPMRVFVTKEAVGYYDGIAEVLGINKLSADDLPEYFNAIEAEMAKFAQENYKKLGGGKTKTIGGIEFVYVPGGTFMMGSPNGVGDRDEHPQHRVSVSGFWIGKYEVTQEQFKNIMGTNIGHFIGNNNPESPVGWDDANDFCNKFSKKYSVQARLPYEAEWEYACRAGTTTKYYWGDTVDGRYCWNYDNSSGTTHPVGQKLPNKWGLYDMSGNVCELCYDWYGESYYSVSPDRDPRGPEAGNERSDRVMRGGSWNNLYYGYQNYNDNRSASRYRSKSGLRWGLSGFRILIPGEN